MTETPEQAFRLAEYQALRAEIIERSKEQVWLESQVIIGSAVIYGVLGTVTTFAPAAAEFSGALWWMPVVLLLFGFFRWKANGGRIGKIGRYIRTMPLENWEKFESGPPDNRNEKRWYWRAIQAGWVAAIILTALVAYDRTISGFLPPLN